MKVQENPNTGALFVYLSKAEADEYAGKKATH